MKLSKLEKITYVGCPWLFGVIYVIVALLTKSKDTLATVIIGGTGLILISLFCVCSLLAKIVDKD